MIVWLACCLFLNDAADWQKAESAYLTNVRQVTSTFARAGEGYFSPEGKSIIYQAEERETGNPFYQIFVQNLTDDVFRRVSPGTGKTTRLFPPRWRQDHLRQQPS